MKLKSLSHRLQFKMKKSSKQQHELEKICRIHCIYTEKIYRLKFNRLFEKSWTESKIEESLVRFQ